jgi:DNA-binding CsgD family transcriptional regulator
MERRHGRTCTVRRRQPNELARQGRRPRKASAPPRACATGRSVGQRAFALARERFACARLPGILPLRLVGIVQDITEARLAQEALQSTSADLGRRALELQQLAVRSQAAPREEDDLRLTQRQLEILRLIAHGLTNAAIAEQLIVSEATVKWHVRQILARTGASNRAEAVARVLGVPRAAIAPCFRAGLPPAAEPHRPQAKAMPELDAPFVNIHKEV